MPSNAMIALATSRYRFWIFGSGCKLTCMMQAAASAEEASNGPSCVSDPINAAEDGSNSNVNSQIAAGPDRLTAAAAMASDAIPCATRAQISVCSTSRPRCLPAKMAMAAGR